MPVNNKIGLTILLGLTAALTYHALTAGFFALDFAITVWIQDLHPEKIFGPVVSYNDRLGNAGIAGLIAIMLMVWLWFRGWRIEAFFIGLVGVTDIINPLLRYIIGSSRPFPEIVTVYRPRPETDFSFPSGTAMHVMMFGGLLLYFSYRLMKPEPRRIILQIFLMTYIILMGMWLIYRGCHWPSDVLGGYLYGAIFLWAIIRGYAKYSKWRRKYPENYVPKERLPVIIRPFAWIITQIN